MRSLVTTMKTWVRLVLLGVGAFSTGAMAEQDLKIGDTIEQLKLVYPNAKYKGISREDHCHGHRWACANGVDFVVQNSTVTAIVVRSPEEQVSGIRVGQTVDQVEKSLGEFSEMGVSFRHTRDGADHEIVTNYKGRNLKIVFSQGRVRRIISYGVSGGV